MSAPPHPSTWHEGERRLQRIAGSADRLEQRVFPPFMPVDHRWFVEQLPLLVVGSVDAQGWPWASIVTGPPGFARSTDARTLRVGAVPPAGDPLAAALAPGAPLGVLGIDFATGGRIRLNGRVTEADASGFALGIDQSFGNCPKYIHPRDLAESPGAPAPRGACALVDGIDAEGRALVARADTFFVASQARPDDGDPAVHGVDASHRGGPPGFVQVAADGTLTIPDYRGNRYFNTLGNLVVNPRAGLLFPDFERGDVLLISGPAEIVFDEDVVRGLPGAERAWRVRPRRSRRLRGALGLRFVASG
jgi:predicted pyridoxine 5'-phosphate oxidase superfamily flavin-nucleotide-binding protein